LLYALKLLNESRLEFSEIKLVFCGSDKGSKKFVETKITELGLMRHVIVLDFITEKEVCGLYKSCISTIMPTFLGPTNLPLLEATMLDCPVLCSDFEGHREILGDDALYFDPCDCESVKKQMELILTDEVREDFLKRIKKRKSSLRFRDQEFLETLQNAILSHKVIIEAINGSN
jgi:glycosyltransferase involved in cell wall biosynthesis